MGKKQGMNTLKEQMNINGGREPRLEEIIAFEIGYAAAKAKHKPKVTIKN
jgi:hypothetical protein